MSKKKYTKTKAKKLYKEMNAGLKQDKDLISKYMHDDHINANCNNDKKRLNTW